MASLHDSCDQEDEETEIATQLSELPVVKKRKGYRLRSHAWKLFNREKMDGETFGICKLCKWSVKVITGCTTGMLDHAKDEHLAEWEQLLAGVKFEALSCFLLLCCEIMFELHI